MKEPRTLGGWISGSYDVLAFASSAMITMMEVEVLAAVYDIRQIVPTAFLCMFPSLKQKFLKPELFVWSAEF